MDKWDRLTKALEEDIKNKRYQHVHNLKLRKVDADTIHRMGLVRHKQ